MKSVPNELRRVVDRLCESVGAGFASIAGRNVDIGLPAVWTDQTLAARQLPIRAAVIDVDAPLRDSLIAVSAAHLEKLEPLLEAGAAEMLRDLGLDAHGASSQATAEYVSADEAGEQLDALWGEVIVTYGLPLGDVVVVFGTGLLQSAKALIDGAPDVVPMLFEPLDRAMLPQRDELPVDPASFEAPDEPMETGSIHVSDAPMLEVDGATPSPTAELQLDADPPHFGVAPADPLPMQHSGDELMHDATQRWSQLLSGVHVDVTAELGRTDLALGDIASLVADSVLCLDQMVDEPLTVYVNGTRFATARLVVVGDEYGIEILQVMQQPQLAASTIAA